MKQIPLSDLLSLLSFLFIGFICKDVKTFGWRPIDNSGPCYQNDFICISI